MSEKFFFTTSQSANLLFNEKNKTIQSIVDNQPEDQRTSLVYRHTTMSKDDNNNTKVNNYMNNSVVDNNNWSDMKEAEKKNELDSLLPWISVVSSFDARTDGKSMMMSRFSFLLDDFETNWKFEWYYNLTDLPDVLFPEYLDVIDEQNLLRVVFVLHVCKHAEIGTTFLFCSIEHFFTSISIFLRRTRQWAQRIN